MAENDIYNSKGKYETFVKNYEELALPPEKRPKRRGKAKYWCKNKSNLIYYTKFFEKFDAIDISYVRRLRLVKTFNMIVHATDKDLKSCERKDIDKIMAFMHTRYKSPKSKRDFVRDIKYMWKILFPEKDEKGRIDETKVPYAVRHLIAKVDISREKRRDDRIDYNDYKKLVAFFSDDPCMQAAITLMVESLVRPQELFYTRIKDYTIKDNYAEIWISEHGKEGTGLLQCFDSFPYVLKWFEVHPLRNDKRAFFFLNFWQKQLKPNAFNKQLRLACEKLGIPKVTGYSLKRNGVTFQMLAGKSPQSIMHTARWTSLKQLQTYSKMTQRDNFYIEGIKKGKIKEKAIIERYKDFIPGMKDLETKECEFCGNTIGFSDSVCSTCKRPTDREQVKENIQNNDELKKQVEELTYKVDTFTKAMEIIIKDPDILKKTKKFI